MCVHPWRVFTILVSLAAVSLGPRVIPFWAQAARAQDTAGKPAAVKSGPDEMTIRALVAQLGDDAFDLRQAAQKRLADIGEPALEMLRKAAKDSPDAEVRARAQRLVLEIGHQHFRTLLKDKRWGALVDPEFDCTFRVDQGQLHVKIPPKPHILSAEIGGTNAPRVLREVEGDIHAEVTVMQNTPAGYEVIFKGLKVTAPNKKE